MAGGGIGVARCTPAEVDEVAAFVADQQRDPTRHVAYLSVAAGAIAAELTALEPDGIAGTWVARLDGELVGVLSAEHDTDPPRVWWHGPFVADGHDLVAIGDALDAAARATLPATVTQEEWCTDVRHTTMAAFARSHGGTRVEGSAVLARTLDVPWPAVPDTVAISPWTPGQRDAVAALHDAAFPATHLPGQRLDEGTVPRVVLAASLDGEVVGYSAAECQEDGTGYLDFLAVTSAVRGRGIGGALIAATGAALGRLGCREVHLTVRESNHVARRLYERLGFAEERVLAPWRRGFPPDPGGA